MAYIGKKKIRALENGGALVIFGMKRPPNWAPKRDDAPQAPPMTNAEMKEQ